MAVTISVLIDQVRRLCYDSAELFSDDLVYDGIKAGHYAILPWIPKRSVADLSSDDEGNTTSVLTLPSDVYEVQTVIDLQRNEALIQNTISITGRGWFPWPHGKITLSYELDSGGSIRVYYFAHWEIPSIPGDCIGDEVLEVPDHALYGLTLYAASHCLAAYSSSTSNIAQFKQRIDSGTPVDNPIMESSKYMYQRFLNEMKSLPVIKRA